MRYFPSGMMTFLAKRPGLLAMLISRLNLFALMAAPPPLYPVPDWHLGTGQEQSSAIMKARKQAWQLFEQAGVSRSIRWLRGLKVYAHPCDESSRALFLTGMFEPNEFLWLEQTLKRGMVMIDIGANMGLYTLFAASCVGHTGSVMAIEPSQREFERLQANVRLNRLSNVRCVKAAAYNYEGEADLRVASIQNAGHNTLGQFGYEGVITERLERVRLERLDDLVQQAKLPRVDVIKIDVEGAERFVLEGAHNTIEQFHPTFLMELSDRMLQHQNSDSQQILVFFEEQGYSVYEFSGESGLLMPLASKSYYYENIVAVYSRPV